MRATCEIIADIKDGKEGGSGTVSGTGTYPRNARV